MLQILGQAQLTWVKLPRLHKKLAHVSHAKKWHWNEVGFMTKALFQVIYLCAQFIKLIRDIATEFQLYVKTKLWCTSYKFCTIICDFFLSPQILVMSNYRIGGKRSAYMRGNVYQFVDNTYHGFSWWFYMNFYCSQLIRFSYNDC